MRKTIVKSASALALALPLIFGGGIDGGGIVPTPAHALTCNLLEQIDEWDHRRCLYTCVKSDGTPLKYTMEKRWMKCTTCRQTFGTAKTAKR